jgi:glycosyltransferase involved in cell wall biosynthesis
MSVDVDIVLPVYNRVEYLPAAVQSVVDQSFTDWQLYIVDDGSTEDIQATIKGFEPNPKIRILHQENLGNAAARNAGIQAGKSAYVAMLDSDDVWHPSFLSQCLQRFRHPDLKADIVCTDYRYIDPHGNLLQKQPGARPFNGEIINALLMGMAIPPSTAILKREIFDRWGGFTPGMDDWELWLRLAWNGCHFAHLADVLVDYRIHPENYHKNWQARRQIHLCMLDHFYRTPGLDEKILTQKTTVYAWQYFLFGIQALHADYVEIASGDLSDAFRAYPELLRQADVYWKLACAHQAAHEMGSPAGFSAERAAQALLDFGLAVYDSLGQVDGLLSRSEYSGRANHTLGMLDYTLSKDYRAACTYLTRAIRAWPAIVHQEAVLVILLKSFGKRLYHQLRPSHG